jgi:hypothetical protein
MAIALQVGALRVIALLSSVMLIAGCTENAVNSPPAPISSNQDFGVTDVARPTAPARSRNRALVSRPRHRSVVAALKPKRHVSVEKKRRGHAKTVARIVHPRVAEPETAANSGVVHHIGPKIIPLD